VLAQARAGLFWRPELIGGLAVLLGAFVPLVAAKALSFTTAFIGQADYSPLARH
jgi:uncharacterized membrane protein YphA (DoxX/SURF4 family)